MKLISVNRKVKFSYEIIRKLEAGIELYGSEVKSIRAHNVSIKESFVKINNQHEVMLLNMDIAPFQHVSFNAPERSRTRKLLLHKREILKLEKEIALKGHTIMPTKVYFKGDRVKIEIALCRGKKLYDKRQSLKEKDLKREAEKAQKNLF